MSIEILKLAMNNNIPITEFTSIELLFSWILDEEIKKELKEYFDPTDVSISICEFCEDEEEMDGQKHEFYEMKDETIEFDRVISFFRIYYINQLGKIFSII